MANNPIGVQMHSTYHASTDAPKAVKAPAKAMVQPKPVKQGDQPSMANWKPVKGGFGYPQAK